MTKLKCVKRGKRCTVCKNAWLKRYVIPPIYGSNKPIKGYHCFNCCSDFEEVDDE